MTSFNKVLLKEILLGVWQGFTKFKKTKCERDRGMFVCDIEQETDFAFGHPIEVKSKNLVNWGGISPQCKIDQFNYLPQQQVNKSILGII